MQDRHRALLDRARVTGVAAADASVHDVSVRTALRWATLTLGAAGGLLIAREATAQNAHRGAGHPSARPPRVSAVARTASSDTVMIGRPPVGPMPTPTPVATDSAAGDVAPMPGFASALTTTARPADNHPPNVAGRLDVALSRADLMAPIDAPVGGGSGAAVMHVQVLLDAARFSAGAVSGVWNENTLFALHAFRAAAHLPPGDSVDADVIARLERIVGPRAPVTDYVVSEADVHGPYRRLPGSMYAKAKVDCLCYQSMIEMLGERFHTTADALQRLNPDVDVAHARAGTRLVVPNVARGAAPQVARLVINKTDGSLRGVDAHGVTRFWLPVTVGSPSLPSPTGRLHVVSATLNPRYQYDPVVLGEQRGARPNALLAPGPNSPVGVLWAQLSRPHVGLHGTPDPEDVGYTMSHGCVRMANWDARWLTPVLHPGLVVDFL